MGAMKEEYHFLKEYENLVKSKIEDGLTAPEHRAKLHMALKYDLDPDTVKQRLSNAGYMAGDEDESISDIDWEWEYRRMFERMKQKIQNRDKRIKALSAKDRRQRRIIRELNVAYGKSNSDRNLFREMMRRFLKEG